MKKKIAFALAVLLAFTLFLVGCGSGGDVGGTSSSDTAASTATDTGGTSEATPATSINKKDSIVYQVHVAPNKLDPPFATGAYEWAIFVNIYEGLFTPRKQNFDDIIPWLAESYEISDDNLEWTFKLREGVKFHNGEELTAEDAAYSIMRAKTSAMVAPAVSAFESCEVIDKYSFTLTLNMTYPLVIEMLAAAQLGVTNKALYEEYGEGAREAIVGTGPYKMVEWSADNNVQLEYFEDYWGDEPQIKEVLFRPILDYNSAAIAFEAGEVDILTRANIADENRLLADPNFSSVQFYRGAHQGVTINNQHPVFSDVRVRQAMNYALDNEAINAIVTEGSYNPNVLTKTGALGEGYAKALSEGRLTEYAYNLEEAQRLMQEAGYSEDNRVTTTMLCTTASVSQNMCQAVQDSFAQIYIDVTVEPMETGTWLNRVGGKDFEISYAEWGFEYYWSPLLYYFDHHTGLFYNYENLQNPIVDEMSKLGLEELDKEKREEYGANLLEEVTAQAVCAPLWQPRLAILTTKGLKAYPDFTNGFCPIYMLEWVDEDVFQYDAEWIPNDMQQ